MKTIGQIIHHRTFPLEFLDSDGNLAYSETFFGDWARHKYSSLGIEIYFEDSSGYVEEYEDQWE